MGCFVYKLLVFTERMEIIILVLEDLCVTDTVSFRLLF